MLGSHAHVLIGSGKHVCTVTIGGLVFGCAASPQLLCIAVLAQEQSELERLLELSRIRQGVWQRQGLSGDLLNCSPARGIG